jgi:hypothetical protein
MSSKCSNSLKPFVVVVAVVVIIVTVTHLYHRLKWSSAGCVSVYLFTFEIGILIAEMEQNFF